MFTSDYWMHLCFNEMIIAAVLVIPSSVLMLTPRSLTVFWRGLGTLGSWVVASSVVLGLAHFASAFIAAHLSEMVALVFAGICTIAVIAFLVFMIHKGRLFTIGSAAAISFATRFGFSTIPYKLSSKRRERKASRKASKSVKSGQQPDLSRFEHDYNIVKRQSERVLKFAKEGSVSNELSLPDRALLKSYAEFLEPICAAMDDPAVGPRVVEGMSLDDRAQWANIIAMTNIDENPFDDYDVRAEVLKEIDSLRIIVSCTEPMRS